MENNEIRVVGNYECVYTGKGKGKKYQNERMMAAMDRVLSRVLYHGSQSPGLELILGFPSSHEIHLIRNPSVDMVDQFMVKLDQAVQRNKSKAGLYSYGNEHSTSKLVGSLIAQAKDIVESEFEGITSDEKKARRHNNVVFNSEASSGV